MSNQILIDIELPLGQAPLSFRSLESIENWLERERGFWAWLSKGALKGMFTSLANHRHRIQGVITKIRALDDANEIPDSNLTELKTSLEAYVQSGPRLQHSDRRAVFCSSFLESEDEEFATYLLKLFHNRKEVVQNAKGIRALLEFWAYSNSLSKENSDSAAEEFEQLNSSFVTRHQSTLDAIESGRSEIERLKIEIEKTSKYQQEEFEKSQLENQNRFVGQHQTSRLEWKQIHDESKRSLEATNKTYDEFMSLKAPVSYWDTKAEKHSRWALYLIIVFTILFAGLCCVLGYEAYKFVSPVLDQFEENPQTEIPLSLILPRLGIMGLTATFGIWPLRLISKNMLSQLHLSTEAKHRSTVLMTYLAMLRKDVLSETERSIILETIFKPISTGVVKDDGAPPTALDLVNKVAKG